MKLQYKETVGDLVVEYEFEGDVSEVVRAFEALIGVTPQASVNSNMDNNIETVLNSVLYHTRKGGMRA